MKTTTASRIMGNSPRTPKDSRRLFKELLFSLPAVAVTWAGFIWLMKRHPADSANLQPAEILAVMLVGVSMYFFGDRAVELLRLRFKSAVADE